MVGMTEVESKFASTPEKGEVSGLLLRPERATHLLVLGHGASSHLRHRTVQSIARALAEVEIATFRYNFPFSENKTGRDSQATCVATVRSAVAAAARACPGLPLLAGGHSFGGRMTTNAAAESPLDGVEGLALFGFPLHPPGKPSVERAEHLDRVTVPMLFVSGSRDEFATPELLEGVVGKFAGEATLHWVEGAAHGLDAPKKARAGREPVMVELARAVRDWAARH